MRITRPFYFGVYVVTQEDYERVMGVNPSDFSATGKGKDKVAGQDTKRFPVENVSWDDAVEFCCADCRKWPEENAAVRLVSAAFGGTVGVCVSCGDVLVAIASFRRQSPIAKQRRRESAFRLRMVQRAILAGRPHAVGGKRPERLGYCMIYMGTCWSGVQDWYDMDYYARSHCG